jgi:hypothetical protein
VVAPSETVAIKVAEKNALEFMLGLESLGMKRTVACIIDFAPRSTAFSTAARSSTIGLSACSLPCVLLALNDVP